MAIRQPRPQFDEPDGPSRFDGKRMGEAAYLALPEVKPYLELVDGVVRQKPMVNAAHRRLVFFIDLALGRYVEVRGGEGGPEGRVRLDERNYRLPDTAYWAQGRASGDDSVPSVAFEVRSPGQSMAALRAKCRAFRRAGADTCWLIDPEARTAELFEAERDGEPVSRLESLAMPGFALELSELFAVLDR